MIKGGKCEVCKEEEQKYRCPTCRILYCSVACFKQHKDDCHTRPDTDNKKDNSDSQATGSENVSSIPEFTLPEEETEDRVPLEKLKNLETCEELKAELSNPHLRQMLMSLVQTKDPAQLIEKSMQEPIFTEFVDTCLSVIDGGGTEEIK